MGGPPQQSFLCPVTVGRAAELDSLRAFLSREGGVLLLSGEAGVGKSRLVREACSLATAAELHVLVGRCFEADRALPFAPALDVLRALVDDHGAAEIAQRAGPAAVDLARLLPELTSCGDLSTFPVVANDPETAKRRVIDGFARLVTGIAHDQALLLVIEDIHWTDTSSLESLLHLARRTSGEPLFLLITYRSDEVDPDLEHFLATLNRERLATEIALDQLDAAEAATMLQAIFGVAEPAPADLLHTVYSLTEGNPFFIEEVLSALGAEQSLVTPAGAWAHEALASPRIPRSIHDAVRRRLGGLNEPARDVLTLAAVAGRRFDFDLLCALSGHDEADLLDLVRELVDAQLVVEESGDRFAFRHALTREAIDAGLLDRERRWLHKRVAAAIVNLGASSQHRLDDLAAHYFAAGSWAQALDAARRAGSRAASLHAPRAAAEHFSHAIESARALGLPPDAELHRERGRAYETLGDFDHARADHELALSLARSERDPRGEWQTLLDLSLLWASRDYAAAGRFAELALAAARGHGEADMVAHSLNRLGNWRLNKEQPRDAIVLHREALQILEAHDDDLGVAETLDLLGMSSVMGTDSAAAIEAFGRAVDIWRKVGDRRGLAASLMGCAMGAYSYHTSTIAAAVRIEEVRPLCEEGFALSQEIDWRAGETWALWAYRGMALGAAGHYETALPATREALRIAHEIAHQQWITAARCILGNLYVDFGAFAAAREHLEVALALARQIDSLYWVRSAAGWLASGLVREGDLTAAATVLRDELHDEIPQDTIAGRLLWCAAAELALAQGQPARALDIVDRLVESTPGGARRPIPRLENLRGEALTTLGRDEAAEIALLTARDEAIWSCARPLLWHIETALARLCRAQARRDEADCALVRARAIVEVLATRVPDDALSATFLASVERVLPPTAHATGRDFTVSGGSPLTPRERQVAALLTEGLTNREVGDRLFLSEWTIATHVRNILAKLELSSRTQIAAWAARQGVQPNA